jgi:hypothetical protein
MLSPRRITHLENAVLDASSLSSGPMDASCRAARRNARKIEDEVSDLAVKHVRGSELQSVSTINVAVDKPKPTKFCCSFQYWQAIWVANDLSVVVVDNG